MVVIRLRRLGAKKRPFYHVVVADSRFASTGRFIEQLGFFNPIARGKEERLRLNAERLQYWISVGAQASDRVQRLMKENEMGPEAVAKMREEKRAAKVEAKKAAAAAVAAAAAAEGEGSEAASA
ncbi:MAG: 30S ribosomal protein S16 [Candidatus Anaerobiospirillum merdipullorum]|uniref:Small ribosomal subunit protein bS16 n=1 Tax=Candidatus Anaerobiospirillum merdipullorum TaxID=2838450 RepID=A0A9E2KN19_9GAMM|nr:30S ribosomal protein S16 [Candidatus Anaerobiospirillum merdipullorum]